MRQPVRHRVPCRRASVWLSAISVARPDIHAACLDAYRGSTTDGVFVHLGKREFKRCPGDSIDYAVMERLAECGNIPGVVVPMDAPWSDVGSWDAIWEILPRDAAGNVGQGRVIFEDTANSFAHSQGRLIACVGLRDLVVVETADAILVADRHGAQQVRAVVRGFAPSAATRPTLTGKSIVRGGTTIRSMPASAFRSSASW